MQRTVNKQKVKKWLAVNGPNAEAKLSLASGLSISTITKIKQGIPPKKDSSLIRLADAMGDTVDGTFPQIATESCHFDNNKSGKEIEHGNC